jgi:DNA-binding CsgD family transcriptional regulator
VADAAAIADIYCRLLSACEHAADVRRAEEWIAAADRLVAAAWSDFVAPSCRCHYGGILIARGRWTEAEEQLLSALGAFEDGYRAERASPLVRLAALRVLQGRLEEAEQMLGGLDWHPAARASLAAIALARGDHEVAEDLARRCVEGEDPSSPACGALLELLAAAQLARDDEEGARATIARLAVLASGCGSERVAAMAGLAEGRLLAVRGDPAGASLLARAVEGFSALGLPVEEGRARLALAQALASRSPAAARAEARLAMSLLEDLGARRDADAAAGLLRMLGDPGRSRAHAAGPLTGREAEVLSLLAAGLSNAAIAKRLVISRRTAEHHVASILGKLGVRTRAEAIARALREGPPDT